MKKFIKIAAALALLALSSICVDIYGSLFYAVIIPIIATPAAISAMHVITLIKKERLIRYNKKAPLFLLKSRIMPYIITICAAIWTAAALPVRLRIFTVAEIIAILPTPFIFLLSKYTAKKVAARIYNEKYAEYAVIRFTRIMASFLMAIVFPLITFFLGNDQNQPIVFADNMVASLIAEVFYAGDEVLNAFLVVLQGTTLSPHVLVMIFMLFLGNGILFYFLFNFFAFFFMKKREILSVFLPVDESPAKPSDKFIYSFIITLLLFFIYPSLFAALQGYLINKPEIAATAQETAKISVELINGAAYKLGTWQKIKAEKEKFHGSSKAELERAADEIYDAMIINTDKYLDWYYSLSAEYGRILRLLSGSFESYMEENLKKRLLPENDSLSETIDGITKYAAELSSAITKILAENRTEYKNGEYEVALDVNVSDIYGDGKITETIGLKTRLTAGAIAGAAAGKIAAKATFKLASKAVAKAAAQKAAGAAIGAAAGVISGIFTSPLGGIATGAAVGIAIDKGLLSLEEMINRDEYKAEIITAINEARGETKAAINAIFEE